MKKVIGLIFAVAVVAFVVSLTPPVSADPDPVPEGNTCICHAVQQNKAEPSPPGDANANFKYVRICPNRSSASESKNAKGHAAHPDDVVVPSGESCPLGD